MSMSNLLRLAEMLKTKNEIDAGIALVIGRPASIGYVGEYIASRVFEIELEKSASCKGIDGHFICESLAEKSVNVKWYTKQDGLLDINPDALPDYYLVLTGPHTSAYSSRGTTLPWIIEKVFLFDSKWLMEELKKRKVKLGIATSVIAQLWEEAEIYPNQNNRQLILKEEQRKELFLFG